MSAPAAHSPPPMDHHEKMRLRAAAFRATQLYPGPAGQVLQREIVAFEDFGYRLAADGLVMRLVQQLLTTPTPAPPAAT